MSKKKTQKTAQKPAAKRESEDLLEQNSENKPAVSHSSSGSGSYGSIGALLRQRRQEQDKSLHDIAASINIRVSQLQALEDENLSALPGMTYALGFLRSYADHLGLDGNEIVARFKESHQKEISEKPELHFPVPASETLVPGSKTVWISLIALVFLVGVTAILYEKNGGDIQAVTEPPQGFAEDAIVGQEEGYLPPGAVGVTAGTDVPLAGTVLQDVPLAESAATMPPMPSGEQVANAPPTGTETADAALPVEEAAPAPAAETLVAPAAPSVETPMAAPAPAAETPVAPAAPSVETPVVAPAPAVKPEEKKLGAPRPGQGRVVVKSTQNSWVQISDAKGKIVLRKVLRPGDVYTVPDQPGLTMVTTNAGGLEITVDGKAIRPLGKPGDIIRGIDLGPNDLKKR